VKKDTAAISDTKQEAEAAVRRNARSQESPYDFYTPLSATALARSQGVNGIRKLGQIRTFSNTDPKEAELFLREVRRWRREDRSGRRTA
jgi:hypothetical protein